MEILWFNSGRKHWQRDAEDWLCLRASGDSSVERIILHEDTHHYFREMYCYDTSHQCVRQEQLDSVGPFEIDLNGADVSMILVLTQFFGYSRAPFSGVETVTECKCGDVIRRNGVAEPILKQIHGEMTGLQQPARRFPTPDAAFRHFLKIDLLPVVELCTGDPKINPVMLKEVMALPVSIYLINEEKVDAGIETGKMTHVTKFSPEIFHAQINPGQHSPVVTVDGRTWQVALPVVMKDPDQGMVGRPLIRRPLISNLKISPLAGRVYASWDWHGPREWMKVFLEWDFYHETGWADRPDSLEVKWPIYSSRHCVELFHRTPWRGWNIQLKATAFLLDESQPPITAIASL